MKQKRSKLAGLACGLAATLSLTFSPSAPSAAAQETLAEAKAEAAAAARSPKDAETVAAFEGRVKGYVDLREGIEEKMTPLPKDATPEQIETHKAAFMEAVRQARAGAKHGDLFTPEAILFIRSTINNEVKGEERKELVAAVLEAENKGVPLRINYPYPEDKELLEMPPTLLLKLPQLPKQVKYRFVGRNLLLVDRENTLIVDYMTNALP